MAQSPTQGKNKSLLSTLKNKLTVNALIVVGTLLMLGVLIYIIIWLLMQQNYVGAGILAFITFGGFVLLGYSSKWFEWVGLKAYEKIGTTTEIARPPRKIS